MRRFPTPILMFLLLTSVLSGADAAFWLERASDAKLSLREREYAARQVVMLADPSASILVAALRGEGSDSALRRQVAAGLLGELGLPAAEAPLLEAASDKDYFLAEAAAAALAKIYSRLSDADLHSLYRRGGREAGTVPGGAPPDEDDWLVLSQASADAKARFRTLVLRGLALKYRDDAERLPEPLAACVVEALADAHAPLRESAVPLVAKCPGSDATERLAAFLYTEHNPKLLAAGLRVLAALRPPDYGAAAERHAGHDDPMVQLEALAALDAMGYEYALFPIQPGARAAAVFVVHPSTPVRRRAIGILADSRNPAALEYLLAALFDRVGRNRAAAAEALGDLGFAGAVGGLSPLLNDGRPEVRAAAAVALSRFGVVGVTSRVVDDLEGDSPPFRRAAAEALGRMGDARAMPALIRALSDADAELACLAAEALGRLGSRDAGRPLFECMRGASEPILVDAARRALDALYRDDPGVSPAGWDSWARRNRIDG